MAVGVSLKLPLIFNLYLFFLPAEQPSKSGLFCSQCSCDFEAKMCWKEDKIKDESEI
jgi:hypothetical protein